MAASGAAAPFLTEGGAERAVTAHVRAFFKTRKLGPADGALSAETVLDEGTCGLDSLLRLELIATLTRAFDLTESGVEDYLVVQPTLGDWAATVATHFRMVGPMARLCFETSGSTGAPKLAWHAGADLLREIAAQREVLGWPDTPDGRVLALVPGNHIYGFLFTVLLPDRVGAEVIDLTDRPPSAVGRVARAGDLIVATPFHWQTLLASGVVLPPGAFGLVSTAPAPAELWPETAARGLSTLIEIYGSTETAGLAWRAEPGAPFALLPHLTRAGDRILGASGQDLDLQDRLDWCDATHFHLAGRRDGIVQVGGVNVSPEATRDVLVAFDGVAEAVVRHAEGRLHAYVVPRGDAEDAAFLADLRAGLAKRLPAPARPATLTIGAALPRTETGKIANWLVT